MIVLNEPPFAPAAARDTGRSILKTDELYRI